MVAIQECIPNSKASKLTSVMLQLQRANVDVLGALLADDPQELAPAPEPAVEKQPAGAF